MTHSNVIIEFTAPFSNTFTVVHIVPKDASLVNDKTKKYSAGLGALTRKIKISPMTQSHNLINVKDLQSGKIYMKY